MDKKEIINALKEIKTNSPKRNFKQSIELIVNLKGIDLKKTDNQINTFANLHYGWGKKLSVCAFVGPELKSQAKEVCDETITQEDFEKYKDKKLMKKLARTHDLFIAQANIMAKVATSFGRVLGPLGKMPNPKIGGVLPPNGNVKATYERFQKTKKLMSRNFPLVQCSVGLEDQEEAEIIDNITTIYNKILSEVPAGENNIRNVYLKLTMGKPVLVGGSEEAKEEPAKKVKVTEKPKDDESPKEDDTSKEDKNKEEAKEEAPKEEKSESKKEDKKEKSE